MSRPNTRSRVRPIAVATGLLVLGMLLGSGFLAEPPPSAGVQAKPVITPMARKAPPRRARQSLEAADQTVERDTATLPDPADPADPAEPRPPGYRSGSAWYAGHQRAWWATVGVRLEENGHEALAERAFELARDLDQHAETDRDERMEALSRRELALVDALRDLEGVERLPSMLNAIEIDAFAASNGELPEGGAKLDEPDRRKPDREAPDRPDEEDTGEIEAL